MKFPIFFPLQTRKNIDYLADNEVACSSENNHIRSSSGGDADDVINGEEFKFRFSAVDGIGNKSAKTRSLEKKKL